MYNEIDKLKRIIKYSASEPTYYLDFNVLFGGFLSCKKYTLYIYVDKKEYIVELKELENEDIKEKKCEFKVEDNFAYFNILCWKLGRVKRHEFIIDFKNGKYVYSSKGDKELNVKENVEEITE